MKDKDWKDSINLVVKAADRFIMTEAHPMDRGFRPPDMSSEVSSRHRRSGNTTWLLKSAMRNPNCILVFSTEELAHNMTDKYDEMLNERSIMRKLYSWIFNKGKPDSDPTITQQRVSAILRKASMRLYNGYYTDGYYGKETFHESLVIIPEEKTDGE